MSQNPELRALSFQQPWLWAVLRAGKRLDNRPRGVSYRGELLLHASLGGTREAYAEASSLIERVSGQRPPAFDDVERGGYLGIATVRDCLEPGSLFLRGEPWYMPTREGKPQFGLLLQDVTPLPFLAARGALGIWRVNFPTMCLPPATRALVSAIDIWRARSPG